MQIQNSSLDRFGLIYLGITKLKPLISLLYGRRELGESDKVGNSERKGKTIPLLTSGRGMIRRIGSSS